ncbi:hypothetical protein LB507_005762 [Fusarium sp. FIESC RH6]|nr:hypothetical protein LB507_005762 [Fusarium sp. FIESC RH6]
MSWALKPQLQVVNKEGAFLCSDGDAGAGPPTAPTIQTKHRRFAARTIHYPGRASHSRLIILNSGTRISSSYSPDKHFVAICASLSARGRL